MKQFRNGVSYYTPATCTVYFPEDDLVCMRCPLMANEYKPDRDYCRLTGEYLLAARDTIGQQCPLIFNKENSNEQS